MTPLEVTLTLSTLSTTQATFAAYLRLEPTDPAAEGFGLEGATMVKKTISRECWEGLGMPATLAVRLRTVEQVRA